MEATSQEVDMAVVTVGAEAVAEADTEGAMANNRVALKRRAADHMELLKPEEHLEDTNKPNPNTEPHKVVTNNHQPTGQVRRQIPTAPLSRPPPQIHTQPKLHQQPHLMEHQHMELLRNRLLPARTERPQEPLMGQPQEVQIKHNPNISSNLEHIEGKTFETFQPTEMF